MKNRHFFDGNYDTYMAHRQRNRRIFGLGVAFFGILFLLKALGVLSWYSIHLTWPIILIAVGLFVGIKHNFRNHSWWILMFIGAVNLVPEFTIMGRSSENFVWPLALIVGGVMIALRPRKYDRCYTHMNYTSNVNTDGLLDINVAFGGKKEMITNKDFKGGVVDVNFAGCELNLSQADMTTDSVTIDFRVSFAGVEMVIPSNWDVRNEISPSFGSVEDERVLQVSPGYESRKTLILRGNVSFGSIELKSY
jgi:hypothetical protein